MMGVVLVAVVVLVVRLWWWRWWWRTAVVAKEDTRQPYVERKEGVEECLSDLFCLVHEMFIELT